LTISELRFPIETQKPLEKSGGFFNFQNGFLQLTLSIVAVFSK